MPELQQIMANYMDNDLPIGMFDSGVGGLTVFKAIADLLPAENLLYLGDTARVPYGTKSRDTISRYTLMAASKLASFGVKMLVIACNTATSAALPLIAEKFAPVPVIGVIEPGAKAAVQATRNGHIGVIGTEATINGQAYQLAIARILPEARVKGRACTLLVPLAEEGWLEGEIAEGVVKRYLAEIFGADDNPDTLLLGCTHFPLFRKTIEKLTGPDIAIVDSASATATSVQECLAELNLARSGKGKSRFMTTDNPGRFARTGSLFMGMPLATADIEVVEL